MLGVFKAGGVYLPLDSDYPKERLAFMQQDWTATASDGNTAAVGELVHPRSFGTFATKLQNYVEKEHVITLPFAIRAATSLPAAIMGFKDRGIVQPGY